MLYFGKFKGRRELGITIEEGGKERGEGDMKETNMEEAGERERNRKRGRERQ